MNWFIPLKCPNCGSAFKESERYCPTCGTDLEAPLEKDTALARDYFEKAKRKYDLNTQLHIALRECELSLGYDPEFAEAHNLHGLILDALHRTEEAIAAYYEALRLNPNLREARENLRDAEEEEAGTGSKPTRVMASEERKNITKAVLAGVVGMAAIAILTGVGWIFFKFALPYLTPKTEIVLIPDVPEDVQVQQSDLELAAQILTDRAQMHGYSQVTFEARSNGEIVGRLPISMDATELVDRIGSIGLLEFVDFGETPIPEDTIIRTDLENEYIVQVEGETWHTVMSNSDILTAAVLEDPIQVMETNYQVGITMTSEGKQVFAEHTQNNIGTFLGIVLDKVVISSPIIQNAIPDGEAVITGYFTEQSAQELAIVLKTKPLPSPLKLANK